MTTFLLDLWQDLRAKRLWPVAVALLAATVAVPAVLFKPASSAPPPSTATTASNEGKLPAVTLDASSISGSHLDVFKQKNPFASESDPTGGAGVDGQGPLGDSVGKAVEKAGGSTDGGSGGGSGGSGLGGSTTPSGDTSGPAPKGPDGEPMEPGVHYFTYTADVEFGARGRTKSYKGLQELDLLPDGDSPVVAFMGVRSGKTAMFFIADPAFRAEGEGQCSPSPDNCMFVYLRTDEGHNEETLSAQNGQVEFVLKLEDLHTKGLSEDQALGDTTPDKSGETAKRSRKQRKSLLSLPQARMLVR
ncbi:MAG TPA: hypothetical protein VJT75_09950 [Thermoleophilaceae bacterium]|nr:hypothetical protein [Thermoleophilaceae bacterium]